MDQIEAGTPAPAAETRAWPDDALGHWERSIAEALEARAVGAGDVVATIELPDGGALELLAVDCLA